MKQRADTAGVFDARYVAFLETVSHLRTRLHRYCAHMTGSVLDGEDVMQEALLEAYRKLEQLEDPKSLRAWLFRIAHNRCIDALRRKQVHKSAEAVSAEPDVVFPIEPAEVGVGQALERIVIHLPPKERACILLKDVFDYSLSEIAELVDSTAGGVKAALNRGRAKLAALPRARMPNSRQSDPALATLLDAYVRRFNQRDWDGVRALTSADARLQVADCFSGRLADSPYFAAYQRGSIPWRMVVGKIDDEFLIVALSHRSGFWQPAWPVRITVEQGAIVSIADYYACPWVISSADKVRAMDQHPGVDDQLQTQ